MNILLLTSIKNSSNMLASEHAYVYVCVSVCVRDLPIAKLACSTQSKSAVKCSNHNNYYNNNNNYNNKLASAASKATQPVDAATILSIMPASRRCSALHCAAPLPHGQGFIAGSAAKLSYLPCAKQKLSLFLYPCRGYNNFVMYCVMRWRRGRLHNVCVQWHTVYLIQNHIFMKIFKNNDYGLSFIKLPKTNEYDWNKKFKSCDINISDLFL